MPYLYGMYFYDSIGVRVKSLKTLNAKNHHDKTHIHPSNTN